MWTQHRWMSGLKAAQNTLEADADAVSQKWSLVTHANSSRWHLLLPFHKITQYSWNITDVCVTVSVHHQHQPVWQLVWRRNRAATVVAMLIANSSNDAKVRLAGKETRQRKLTLVDVLQSWWVSLCSSLYLPLSISRSLPFLFLDYLFTLSHSLPQMRRETVMSLLQTPNKVKHKNVRSSRWRLVQFMLMYHCGKLYIPCFLYIGSRCN